MRSPTTSADTKDARRSGLAGSELGGQRREQLARDSLPHEARRLVFAGGRAHHADHPAAALLGLEDADHEAREPLADGRPVAPEQVGEHDAGFERQFGSRPRAIGVSVGCARIATSGSGGRQRLVAELAQRVVAAPEQLARDRPTGAVAAEALGGLLARRPRDRDRQLGRGGITPSSLVTMKVKVSAMGAIKEITDVLSVVPLGEVDSLEVKRMGLTGVMEISAGGGTFKLEGKPGDMKELAEVFARAKAAA
jgi:hypothetical protein